MTCGPRTQISPSEAMRISVPGTALPTVPMRKSSKVFTLVTGLVSVSPYPSRI